MYLLGSRQKELGIQLLNYKFNVIMANFQELFYIYYFFVYDHDLFLLIVCTKKLIFLKLLEVFRRKSYWFVL